MESKRREKKSTFLKRKQLHKEKKKVVSYLQNLQQVLGEAKPPDAIEKELEQIVFGGSIDEDDIFSDDENAIKRKKSENDVLDINRKPAWVDDDDEAILVKDKVSELRNCHRSMSLRGTEKYSEYTQEKFKKIVGAPSWADLDRNDTEYDSENEELLMKTGNFIKSGEQLPKSLINVKTCPSLYAENMEKCFIKCVEFNPVSKVALMAGVNQTVNLFQIDGKVNAKIQSIHFENFPIHSAHFTTDGTEIIVGSNKFVHFFSYDMIAGKISKIPFQNGMEQKSIRKFSMSPDGKYFVVHGHYGNIHLMTTKTKEWVGSLKMNGEVTSTAFSPDGSKMYSHGNIGEVYIWDISSRKCLHKFTDEGCMTGSSLALSPNEQYLACGSDSGVVNIYDNKKVFTSNFPHPMKALMNLTTEITSMKFNHSSELLAIASPHKPRATKLVHFPSMSVFANFPINGDNSKLGSVNSLDISLNSGYLSVGNNFGGASIFRLNHFKNY